DGARPWARPGRRALRIPRAPATVRMKPSAPRRDRPGHDTSVTRCAAAASCRFYAPTTPARERLKGRMLGIDTGPYGISGGTERIFRCDAGGGTRVPINQ